MILIVLPNLNLSFMLVLTTLATNLNLFGHRYFQPFIVTLLYLSLLLNLLLHLHKPLELEPLSDLLLSPPLFFLNPPFLSPSALLLSHFFQFALTVLVIILSLLISHTFPLLLCALPLRRILFPELLILRRIIGQVSLDQPLLVTQSVLFTVQVSLSLFLTVDFSLEPVLHFLEILRFSITLEVFNPALSPLLTFMLLVLLKRVDKSRLLLFSLILISCCSCTSLIQG